MSFLRESKLAYAIALVLILCLPTLGLAQPSTNFPPSVQISTESTTYRAFDLGGFRALLTMDADLSAAISELELRRQQVTELTQAVESTRTAVTTLEHTQTVLQAERDRLTLQWQEADQSLQNCENKPRVGPFLGWVLAIVFASASVGLTVYTVNHN